MKKMLGLFLPLALVIFTCAKAENIETSGSNYPQAPAFSLKDLKGNEISLSDYKGKVLFLNFWATWCPPCRYEIPDFVEVYSQYKDKGMEIVGISLDRISLDSLLSFVEKYKINYPVVFGTQKILDDYQPGQFIPTTIIIDKQGKIRYRKIGQMDKESLKNYFLELAAEKS